jgi:hypothetical protein
VSTPYNRGYRPPFPALQVHLQSKVARIGPFQALLDTGADATFVPIDLLEQIKVGESGPATVRSHFGERQRVRLYVVSFEFDHLLIPGIYVVGDDLSDEIILGRDVLNSLPLFLDGPQRTTDLLDDATVNRLRGRRKLA